MTDTSLTYFLSVARTGSFTISARELSGTQQAVSRNILALEEELGFPLFIRGDQSASLTWEGERFYRWCRDIDRQLSLAASSAERMDGKLDRTLRIGWLDWTGCPDELADGIRAFQRRHGDCATEFRQGSAAELGSWVSDNLLDVAVMPEYSTHDLVGVSVSEPFLRVPLHVIVSESCGFTDCPSFPQLSALRCLVTYLGESDEQEVRRHVQYSCAELGLYPEHVEVLPGVRSVFSELACAPGYTIAPRCAGAERWDRLRFFPMPGASMPLVFVSHRENASPWISLFESFLRERRGRNA